MYLRFFRTRWPLSAAGVRHLVDVSSKDAKLRVIRTGVKLKVGEVARCVNRLWGYGPPSRLLRLLLSWCRALDMDNLSINHILAIVENHN